VHQFEKVIGPNVKKKKTVKKL